MQEEFTAKLTGRFVDDDDIVRTGRAMLELDGFNMLHLPIPDGYKEQLDDLFGKAGVSAEAAKKSASAAGASAADAKKSETAAASSASSAKTSASGAASSASSASSSEKKAADSARSAASAQDSVAASASLAQESAAKAGVSEKAAASSASSASTDASKAAASEKNAAASASSAKTDADRVSKIAESTSWNGDKLTVNGKTSPSLRGPKGDPGDPGQDGKDGASEWSEIDDKPATFPPAEHTHAWGQVTDKPVTFPPAEHTHVIGDTTGLQAALGDKADIEHMHGIADVDGLSARLAGIDSALAGKAEKTDLVELQGKIFQATISNFKITQRTNAPGIETEVGYAGIQVNVPAILIIDYGSNGTFFTTTEGVDNPRAMGVHVEFVLAEAWVVIKPVAKVIGIPL